MAVCQLCLLLLAAATVAAASAASAGGGPVACAASLKAFLRSGPQFDFVAEHLPRLRRRDATLLLPLASLPSGSWLAPGIPREVVKDFVANLVLTRNYRTVDALVRAGTARTLAGTEVTFTRTEGGLVVAEFEGLAGARGVVLPAPRAFKGVTVFSVANDQLAPPPSNSTAALASSGRRLAACGCNNAYCTPRIQCCGRCTQMSKDGYGIQTGVCSSDGVANAAC